MSTITEPESHNNKQNAKLSKSKRVCTFERNVQLCDILYVIFSPIFTGWQNEKHQIRNASSYTCIMTISWNYWLLLFMRFFFTRWNQTFSDFLTLCNVHAIRLRTSSKQHNKQLKQQLQRSKRTQTVDLYALTGNKHCALLAILHAIICICMHFIYIGANLTH